MSGDLIDTSLPEARAKQTGNRYGAEVVFSGPAADAVAGVQDRQMIVIARFPPR
jgi:hypothetical protein